jgi:hypothetical protein
VRCAPPARSRPPCRRAEAQVSAITLYRIDPIRRMRIATCSNEDEARAQVARTRHVDANLELQRRCSDYLPDLSSPNRKSWAKTHGLVRSNHV